MKVRYSICTLIVVVVVFAAGEVPLSKRPLLHHNWPAKNSNQFSVARNPGGKQRTLVVQIRSDQPVPLVLKGRSAAHANGHLAHLHHHAGSMHHYARPIQARPLKLLAPSYHLKAASTLMKPLQFRKPLKLKLANSKLKAAKPALTYEKPFQYELPTTTTVPVFADVKQQLPLETHAHFISDHFAPIHTIPAPNLAPLHDNHIHHEDHLVEVQHHPNSQYQVTEDVTNDHTIFDPHSGVQKLYAPDPDPALTAGKVRLALEPYNQPSNGKPLPADIQSNYLPPVAQPLVQIVSAQAQLPQQPAPEIYPIQFAQQQPVQLSGANVAPASYSPTYLISQSNNLYTQHQQQLFKPAAAVVEAGGYANADLTQEVASNGQILQAAKDPHNNIHPVLDTAPQFAALIAAPSLGDNHHHHEHQAVSLRLPNASAAAAVAAPESGFVVSNFFGGAQDSSQLLQSYAEEERQLDAEKHYQLLQHEKKEKQLLLQQQQNHLIELQQQQQQEQLQQQQQLYTQQLQQQHLQQQLQQLQQSQQQQQLIQPHQPQQPVDPSVSVAFEAHQSNNIPLRIFVPDDESEAARIKKRSDNLEIVTEDSPVNDKSLN